MKRRIDRGGLADELAGLPDLARLVLAEKWYELFGSMPAGNISKSLMVRAVAYRLQENALGGMRPSMRRFLKNAEGNTAEKNMSSRPANLKPGTRLIREWHGYTYEVIILENGVFFNDKTHKSLTEVAKIITGVQWSGPKFFGLKKKVA